jgi:hypothetical protein
MKEKIIKIMLGWIEHNEPIETTADKLLDLFAVINWVAFDFYKIETRPTAYGKYLICRKDGNIHWETWNGSGWAYNNNEIRYWAVIVPPCIQRYLALRRWG